MLTFQEAIALARIHDARYHAELRDAEVQSAEGWQAVAGYGPTVRVTGSYLRSRDTLRVDGPASPDDHTASFNEAEITITAEQPLVDLGKAGVAGRGLIDMTIADLRKKKAEEDLHLRVSERYYAVLSSRESHSLDRAETAALKKQLTTAEDKLALGFGTITDRHHAEARYRLALAAEIAGKTALANALTALEEVIGRSVASRQFAVKLPAAPPLPEPPLNRWLQLALTHNTDLQISKQQHDVAAINRRIALSRFTPALVLFADYRDRRPDGGLSGYGEDRSETDIGVRLEMDLLTGGQDVAASVAAGRRLRSAARQVQSAQNALTRSIQSLWQSIAGTRELIETYRQATEASRLALESTQASYDEGAKVLLDVLNAQQDYYRSLKTYKTAHYDYLLLLEKFKLVVGQH
ncbi:MAG: TolC family protein [Desulfofustis sp.]|nr:TolC family protein [Desulfofustis sp.]